MCSSPALCLHILCSKRKIWKKLIHFYRRAKKTSQVIGLQTARKNKILCLILFIPKIPSLNLWNITMVKLWRKQKMHNKFSIVQHKLASVEYSQSASSQETIIRNSCTEFEKKPQLINCRRYICKISIIWCLSLHLRERNDHCVLKPLSAGLCNLK